MAAPHIENIIFALSSPEYYGTKEEKDRLISMLRSPDKEMVELAVVAIMETIKYRLNGKEVDNRDGCERDTGENG